MSDDDKSDPAIVSEVGRLFVEIDRACIADSVFDLTQNLEELALQGYKFAFVLGVGGAFIQFIPPHRQNGETNA